MAGYRDQRKTRTHFGLETCCGLVAGKKPGFATWPVRLASMLITKFKNCQTIAKTLCLHFAEEFPSERSPT